MKLTEAQLTQALQMYLLEFLVLLAEHVEVDGAPDARPLAANHDDRGGIHGEEDPGAAAAVRRVANGFSNGCDKETELYDENR